MKGYLDVFNFLKDVKEINVNAKDNEDIFLKFFFIEMHYYMHLKI